MLYDAIITSFGGNYDITVGSKTEAWVYATAMLLGRMRHAVEKAGNQLDPHKIVEMLPVREATYGVIPGRTASIHDRQGSLAAKMLLPQGARYTAVTAVLYSILGSGFLGYRVTQPSELGSYPTIPGNGPGHWVDPQIPPKVVTLTGTVSRTDIDSTVGYTPTVAGTVVEIVQGDEVVVSANNIGIAEVVDVISADTEASTFTARFAKSHDVGDVCTTGYFPYWVTNQSHVIVLVTPAVANDADKKRLIHTMMYALMRGWVTWDICPSTDGIHPDALTVGDATLGRVGYAGIGFTSTAPSSGFIDWLSMTPEG